MNGTYYQNPTFLNNDAENTEDIRNCDTEENKYLKFNEYFNNLHTKKVKVYYKTVNEEKVINGILSEIGDDFLIINDDGKKYLLRKDKIDLLEFI
jgi:hypothetical protein